jgi:hypothetical protein
MARQCYNVIGIMIELQNHGSEREEPNTQESLRT